MKKTLFGLLSVICALCFFTACSDDDDENVPVNWQDLSKTYEGRNIQLILGENIVPIYGKSVAVEASSETQATLTLNNLLPEEKTFVVDVAMVKSENAFAFSGSRAVSDAKVSVEGKIEKGTLSMVIQRTMNLPFVGNWHLKYVQDKEATVAAVYARIKIENSQFDDMINTVTGPLIGKLLAQKVDQVNIDFRPNGTLGIAWKKVGEEKLTDLKKILDVVNLQYGVLDKQPYLMIDKNFIDILVHLGQSVLEKNGIHPEDLMGLLVDLGGYYGLPLQASVKDREVTFYADKDLIVPVVNLMMPILMPKIPEEYAFFANMIPQILPRAEFVHLGLVLEQ